MADAEECINHAAEVARQATHFDSNGSHQAAIYMYRQAAEYLRRAAALGLSSPAVLDRIQQYKNRADALESSGENQCSPDIPLTGCCLYFDNSNIAVPIRH